MPLKKGILPYPLPGYQACRVIVTTRRLGETAQTSDFTRYFVADPADFAKRLCGTLIRAKPPFEEIGVTVKELP